MVSIYNNSPQHLVAVDCLIFGYEEGELKLLLFHRELPPERGKWSLVGGWVYDDESLEGATQRVIQNITGLKDIFMEQVKIYSEPKRDPGGRVISITFYALLDIKQQDANLIRTHGAFWWPVKTLPELIFDHGQMVSDALHKLQVDSSYSLVGKDLLPEKFTITHLRELYNCIYDKEFDPGNFRKKILALKVLDRLDKKDTSLSKKGSFLYKFKPEQEIEYKELIVNLKNNKVL